MHITREITTQNMSFASCGLDGKGFCAHESHCGVAPFLRSPVGVVAEINEGSLIPARIRVGPGLWHTSLLW